MDLFFSILLVLAVIGLVIWAIITYALPVIGP